MLRKKIKISLLLTLSLFLFSSFCDSQFNRLRKDGLWWNAIDASIKQLYLVGYICGMNLGSELVLSKYSSKSKCYKIADTTFKDIMGGIISIPLGLIAKRMDSVYQDTTNLGLMASRVVWITSTQLLGMDSLFIKDLITGYKKQDCERFKSVQQLKDYNLQY